MILHLAGLTPSAQPFALFDNLFAAPGVSFTASSSAVGFDPASVGTENTWQEWKAGGTSATLTVDLGSPKNFDTLALAANNLGTVGAKVRAEHSLDNVTYTTLTTSATLTTNRPMAILAANPVSARYIRFDFGQAPLPSAPVILAVAAAGLRFEFPGWLGPDFIRPWDAVTVEVQPSQSLEGQYLGVIIRRKAGRLSPRLSPLSRAWADANLAAFRDHHDQARPFFFAPGPAAFTNDLIYGWRGNGAGELRAQVISGGRLVTFGMELDFHAA